MVVIESDVCCHKLLYFRGIIQSEFKLILTKKVAKYRDIPGMQKIFYRFIFVKI